MPKDRSGPGKRHRPWSLGSLGRLLGPSPRGKRPAEAPDDIAAIAASGLFDPVFYLAQVAEPEMKPGKGGERSVSDLIAHYLRKGAAEWLNPSRGFDTGYYCDTHPEVGRTGENPLLHYLRTGRAAGATPVADAADWSPRDVPSAPATVQVARTKRVFVVPAFIGARNTTRYRVRHLAELLGEDSVIVVDWQEPPPDLFPALEAGAIVILQRLPLTRETRIFLHRVRAAAAVVAYDIDDQIFDANELEDWRIAGLEASPARYAMAMALADQFIVSTVGLRAKVERRFRRPAHVLTNCLGRETVGRALAATPPPAGSPFVVGYASGSRTHDEDLKVALPAVERFLRANPRAEFHCIGRLELPEALRREFGARVQHRKAVPWQDLPDELAQFSVQIVPLADCPFNRCKSHIRFLEAAAVGVPSVVSAVGEPAAAVFDGVTGLVCDEAPEAWLAALQRLHDDPALRAGMAEAGRPFVAGHFTTASPFMAARVERILEDLELGFLRDRLSIVVAGDPAPMREGLRQATALPFETSATGRSDGTGLALGGVADETRAIDFLAGLATERYVGLVRNTAPPVLWDLRMLQAAKAIPDLGWLSAGGGSDGGAVDRFPGAPPVVRAIAQGDGPVLAPASARRIAPFGDRDGRRARRAGLYAGTLRGAAAADRPTAEGMLVVIKVCTPVAEDENVWGDTHYARGLAAALAARGHRVRIDKHEEWHDPARPADVAIHLFGIWKYVPADARTNVLWVISHPEEVDAEFVVGFDLVFCASDVIAERVRRLAPAARVATLLQCTDTSVFFPDPGVPEDIDVAFVGNSRKVYRDAVRFAVEEGFDVAVWGTRWEPFIDRRFIRGRSLPAAEVADVYRRSRVVLNDHWDDQKAEGLVNNRIFDVLACDTMVLSDANPGLAALLGGAVPTFASRPDFAATLRALLADPARDASAARLGAEVRRAHTFAERAAAIEAAILALRASG